ncbi:DNA integrity scanning protein DisA nucleotide-binding domain protein [Gottfriedia acidiceleris]|uniref:DNA integrity scanning protein DisA nucleotide-binding domain protein n=1 Tax=Gottfriedia acidiceleris TaxID=371036 RepID=A0ABY4JR88_9BACI|nr:DNA integrity scanning protein DisA nucleotide-binding domain protein [Gottfriedia acidiceleris]UPM56367.1 DNA integrity scanning protein DisA nucleotide-binding domain protein [Gottfriedia acidiceleris]
MNKYENFKEKIKKEFNKIDISDNFYNCLCESLLICIPVKLIVDDYNDDINFRLNPDNTYCLPDTDFTKKLKSYYIDSMKTLNLSKLSNNTNKLLAALDNIFYRFNEMTTLNKSYATLLKNLDDKTFWIGSAHIDSNDEEKLIIPILIFNNEINDYPISQPFSEQWKNHWHELSYDELGRKAAANVHEDLSSTINDIHIISSLKYEGLECKGTILFQSLRKNEKNVAEIIKLNKSVKINDHKRIRKLLEITNKELVLVVDINTLEAFGFKKMDSHDSYDFLLLEDHILINFTGWFSWDCIINGEPKFNFKNLQLKFPISTNNSTSYFKDKLHATFNPNKTNKKHLIRLFDAIKEQKKGTMLVILDSDNVKKEADRLEDSGTLIDPELIEPEIIKQISKIDGAVIIDPEGICYAFGVILDGNLTPGDPARGARFNSAQRYLYTKRENNINCLIVVVSEDGYIDIITTSQLIIDTKMNNFFKSKDSNLNQRIEILSFDLGMS